MFSCRNKKNIYLILPLICSYVIILKYAGWSGPSWLPSKFYIFQTLHMNRRTKIILQIPAGWSESSLFSSRFFHQENNLDPLKPYFYTVKLGFTELYIIFLISAQKHRLWVLIRITSGGSNKYSQSMFWQLVTRMFITLMPKSKRGINTVRLKWFSRHFEHSVVNNKLYVLFFSIVSPAPSILYGPDLRFTPSF